MGGRDASGLKSGREGRFRSGRLTCQYLRQHFGHSRLFRDRSEAAVRSAKAGALYPTAACSLKKTSSVAFDLMALRVRFRPALLAS